MKRWREEKIVINYGEGELYNGECWNLERWCLVGGDKGWKGSTRGEWKGWWKSNCGEGSAAAVSTRGIFRCDHVDTCYPLAW